MLSLQLVLRSFFAVWNNLLRAIVIFGPTLAFFIVCILWLNSSKTFSQDLGIVTQGLYVNIPLSSMNLPLVSMFIIGALIYAASVVTWHRFIIMDGKPVVSPSIFLEPYFGNYIVSALKLIFLSFVLLIIFMFFISLLIMTSLQGPLIALSLFNFAMTILLNAVYLIMCLILPGAAVGQYLRVLETFELTDFGTVLGVSIIINIAEYFAETFIQWFPFNTVLIALFTAFFLVFQISVLTTLYQHYVEKDSHPKT